MSDKTFRDPVYGYIRLESEIVRSIVDTATFQRLRNIRQTSYAPLYPSALHNRFAHSLGVYHLGRLAFRALRRSAEDYWRRKPRFPQTLRETDKWNRYQYVFELACLLHDVGHSPFSHTGEEFYKTSSSSKNLDGDEYTCQKHLFSLTNDEVFNSSEGKSPAPHEIMSCIVALEEFGEKFQTDDEKAFFSRCITGLQYKIPCETDYRNQSKNKQEEILEQVLRNCLIQLLNSKVVDVDRLDYIIRDAGVMGYQSVSVDYERLLNGISVVEEGNYYFTIGFHKNALSVIENAVYAHEIEKKWVQSHPVIAYDGFLLHRSIVYINEHLRKDNPDAPSTLFSYDSLGDKGSHFGNLKIRYLGDADLIYLMKSVYSSSYSEEYLKRNTRRHPVWKSEAEFKNFFTSDERQLIENTIGERVDGSLEINDEALFVNEKEVSEARENKLDEKADYDEETGKYYRAILDVCEQYNIQRSVVWLSRSFFYSNFLKTDMDRLPIMFSPGKISPLGKVSPTLSAREPTKKDLYYLFYYPNSEESFDKRSFAQDILTALKKVHDSYRAR